MSAAQWQAALESRTPPAKPSGQILLRALGSFPKSSLVTKQLVRGRTAYVQVSGAVPVTQQVAVVKDPAGWRVDRAKTDELNSATAGGLFLQTMSASSVTPESAIAYLRATLVGLAKNYQVVEAKAEGADRALVTVGDEMPVSIVLQASRMGPGWAVDFQRGQVQGVDPFSADPLQEAVGLGDQSVCEGQLRQLANAIQMYASSSDDMLPDPSRWLDQIALYLPPGTSLHCPVDPGTGVSYAMNKNLAGKRRREVANAAMVPLLFESTKGTRNAADVGESWAPSRHPGGSMVLFVDGSVRGAPAKPSFEVKQAPPGSATAVPLRPGAGRPGAGPGPGPGPGRPRPQRPPGQPHQPQP